MVVDVDPPESVHVWKTLAFPDLHDVALGGGYGYLLGETSLSILDVEPLNDIHPVGEVEGLEYADSIVIDGDFTYVLAWNLPGLYIIDINPPESAHIAYIYKMQAGSDITKEGQFLYICSSGFRILEIN